MNCAYDGWKACMRECPICAGLKDYKVLKTTQSGYEGYLRDQYTLLPETRDRIMATSVTANWRSAIPQTSILRTFCKSATSQLPLMAIDRPLSGSWCTWQVLGASELRRGICCGKGCSGQGFLGPAQVGSLQPISAVHSI